MPCARAPGCKQAAPPMHPHPCGCRYLLTHLHPMLGGAVGMKGSTVVEARLIPHDGLLPTSQARARALRRAWRDPA